MPGEVKSFEQIVGRQPIKSFEEIVGAEPLKSFDEIVEPVRPVGPRPVAGPEFSPRGLAGVMETDPRVRMYQGRDAERAAAAFKGAKEIGAGLVERPEKFVPIAGSVVSAVKSAEVIAAAKRWEKDDYKKRPAFGGARTKKGATYVPMAGGQMLSGEGLPERWTPELQRQHDEKVLEDWRNEMTRLRDTGRWTYQIGRIVGEMPAFMVEYLLTGGLVGAGKTVAKKGAKEAAERLTKRALAKRLATWAGHGFVRGTAMPQRTAAEYFRRRMPENVRETEAGELEFVWPKDKPFTSFLKAYGDTVIEAASESAGEELAPMVKRFAGAAMAKLPFGEKLVGRLYDGWSKLHPGGTWDDFLTAISTRVGYNGVLTEVGEEYLGDSLRGITGVDDFGAGPDAGPLDRAWAAFQQDVRQTPVMIASFSVPAGVLGVARRVGPVGRAPVPEPSRKIPYEGEQPPPKLPTLDEAAEARGLKDLPIEPEAPTVEQFKAAQEAEKRATRGPEALPEETRGRALPREAFAAYRENMPNATELEIVHAMIEDGQHVPRDLREKYADDPLVREREADYETERHARAYGRERKARPVVAPKPAEGEPQQPLPPTVEPQAPETAVEGEKRPQAIAVEPARLSHGEWEGGKKIGEGDINASYSGDVLSGGRLRKPFTHEGSLYVAVALMPHDTARAWRIVPQAEYKGETTAVDSGGESGKAFTYEGTLGSFRGKGYVLTGGAVEFQGRKPQPAAEGKETWEMTRGEYEKGLSAAEGRGLTAKRIRKERIGKLGKVYDEFAGKASLHEMELIKALRQKKPVPRAVLEEYKGEPWADEALAKGEKKAELPNGFAVGEPVRATVKGQIVEGHVGESRSKDHVWIVDAEGNGLANVFASEVARVEKGVPAEKEPKEKVHEPAKPAEARVEPAASAEVQPGEAGEAVSERTPTGELDPTDPQDALEITRLHAQWVKGGEYFKRGVHQWPSPYEGIHDTTGRESDRKVQYTPEQVEEAYRTVQKPVESGQADTTLWAMPGHEAEVAAIGQQMAKLGKLPTKTEKAGLPKAPVLPRPATKIEDHIKAVYVAAGKENERYAIHGVNVEGDTLVATDGRRLFAAKGEWGKDGLYTDAASLKKGLLGKPGEGTFPKWRDIVPQVNDRDAIEVTDLPTVWRRVRQAMTLTTEENAGIVLVRNKDGSLGFSAGDVDAGHAEINVNHGATILGGIRGEHLADILKFHAKRGDKSFNLWFEAPDKPMMTRSVYGDKTLTVTMPLNVQESSMPKAEEKAAKPPEKTKQGHPGYPGGGWKGMTVTMEPGGKAVSAREIIDTARRAFGPTIRGKATHKMRTKAGWYDPRSWGIRLKDVRELTTAMHEIGHYIDWHIRNRWSLHPPSTKIAKELVALGKALYGKTKPPGGYKSEGWAEFIRMYLTGEDIVAAAPALTQWFTQEYLPKEPSTAKSLATIKGMIDQWRTQGAEQRIESQISRKPIRGTILERLERMVLWADTNWRDQLAPLRWAMKKAGLKDLRPGEDPYQLSIAFADKAPAKAREFVLHGTTDLAGNRNGPGLREIVAPISGEIKPFTRWLFAYRALHLQKRGIKPGISRADAKYVYDKYESPAYQKAAREITDWNHRVLLYLKEAGGITGEALARIRELNPIYVPFMRAFAAGEVQMRGGTGRGVAQAGQPVKRIKGSGREIVDPFESMIQRTERIISTAQKIAVARAMARLTNRQGMASLIWKVPAPIQATSFSASQIKKQLTQIAIEAFGLDPSELAQSTSDGAWDEILTVYTNAGRYFGKDNIVALVVNGERQFYEVAPEVYRLLEGLDQYSLPWFLNITFGKATRALRLGATGLNLSFGWVRNFIRDAMTFTVQAKHAKGGPLAAIGGVAQDVLRTEKAEHFKRLGGKMSVQILQDRAATQRLRREMLATSPGRWVIHTATNPINALREIFGVPEAGTRIAEFDAALDYAEKQWGKGSLDAAVYALNEAQDVTTNFTGHGQMAKILNQMIPFFNAAIRGPDKMVRTFRARPVATTLKAIACLTVPALLAWWRSKDEEWYKRLTDQEKANYLHFRVPATETIVRIPVPFELGYLFQSMPVAALDQLYREDPGQVKDIFGEAAERSNPFDWPALVGPVIDVMRNRTWTGRPIVTEHMKNTLPEDRYYPYTTELMKFVGRQLHYSPAQIEYIVDQYSGGLYGRAARSIDLAVGERAQNRTIADIFLREPYRPSEKIEQFYGRLELLRQKRGSGKISGREEAERLRLERYSRKYLSPLWKALRKGDVPEERKKQLYARVERVLDAADRMRPKEK